MNLYEINEELMKAFETAVDVETGEVVDEDAYAAMDALGEAQMTLSEKAENVLLWYKNLLAEATAYKAEKLVFAERQAKTERKAESLKKYAQFLLGGEKFKTDRVQVSWRKVTSCEVDDGVIWDLPDDFLRYKEPEVDKTALTRALKDGQEIPGARLVTRQSMIVK